MLGLSGFERLFSYGTGPFGTPPSPQPPIQPFLRAAPGMGTALAEQTPAPFVWGKGGQRMSAEQIEIERQQAAQQMAQASDFSPVGHWTQGLARAAGGITGALQMRRANRAAMANSQRQMTVAEALVAGARLPDGTDSVAAALLDPQLQRAGLAALEARSPKPVQPMIQRANNGDIIGLNPQTGETMFTRSDPNPRPVLNWQKVDNGDGTFTFMPFDANGPVAGSGAPSLPTAPVGKLTPITEGGPAQPASGTFAPDAVFNALVQQESGGRNGIPGQMTRYGRPMGATQMLEPTAREMAGKLGVNWRPDLYTGTSAEAGRYQRQLGRAYFDQGLRETGNVRDALHYYHGGPDRRLWGPKTRRYAEEVLQRIGNR